MDVRVCNGLLVDQLKADHHHRHHCRRRYAKEKAILFFLSIWQKNCLENNSAEKNLKIRKILTFEWLQARVVHFSFFMEICDVISKIYF